jgi:hypothetical protein
MKTIVIDLFPDILEKTSILLAIKVYLHKNSDYQLLVVGRSDDLSVLSGVEGVIPQKVESEERTTAVALKALQAGDKAGLLSFAPRSSLLSSAQTLFPEVKTPLYGLSFLSKKEDKATLLIEASGFLPLSEENYEASLAYGLDYLTHVLCRSENAVGLLAVKENLDPVTAAFDAKLHSNPSYRGYVAPSDLFEGECDLVLAGGLIGGVAIGAAKGSRKLMKDLDKAPKKSLSTYLNFGPKKADDAVLYSARFDTKGYFLFGYPAPIVSLNHESNYDDFLKGLEKIESLGHRRFI